jgi:hypothetical protein
MSDSVGARGGAGGADGGVVTHPAKTAAKATARIAKKPIVLFFVFIPPNPLTGRAGNS